MAIRYVSFVVSDDTTVTPNVPQYAGVQGEHNATQIGFVIDPNGRLAHHTYQYFIECVDAAGGYDRTPELVRHGSEITTLMPYAWTQYGGISTVRLVVESNGQLLYSVEGRLQLEERGAAIEKVDGLLRTDLTETLAACRDEVKACHDETETCRAIVGDLSAAANSMMLVIEEAQADIADAIDAIPRVAQDIADDVIWPSRYMAETLCPPLAARGETVTAHPLAGYPIKVKADHKNLFLLPVTAPQEMNGLVFTPHADGSITVDGTATAAVDYRFYDTTGALSPLAQNDIPIGTAMRLSGCPTGGSATTYWLGVLSSPPVSPNPTVTHVYQDMGTGITFDTLAQDYAADTTWQCIIHVAAGTVCNNLTFRPRLARQDDLILAVAHADGNATSTVAAGAVVTMTAPGGEMTFALTPAGVVTVTGRQNVAAFCGDFDAALDSILALQNGLLGGDGA